MFRKVLVWFAGILLFSFFGFVVTTLWTSQRLQFQQELFRRLRDHMFREAVAAYESGGPAELAKALAAQNRDFPAHHHLFDAQGRDLATGKDESSLLTQAREPRAFRLIPPARLLMRRNSPDGRYIYVINAESRMDLFSNLAVYSWLIFAVILLCYALAYTLVRPIRHLHGALTRFGRGDLNSRSNLKRRDELGDLSRAFDEMADRIATLLTAERRLLQDVSHELRSPLARLRFAVQLARTSPEPNKQLARVDKEVDRLSTLIGDLLQVTRAEGDPGSRNLEQIPLRPFVEEIAEDCRIEAEAKSCTIQLEVSDSPIYSGDRELLRRALENVIRNAIHHSPSGSSIQVALHVKDNDVIVEVRDSGPGVPDDALESMFQPFYRVEQDRSRDNGGVGLGLAIARRAVSAHSGRIKALNSHPGLRVEIRLPK